MVDVVAGKVVKELLSAVLEMKDKAAKYKPTLESLENTLQSIEPQVNRIEELNRMLNRPPEETRRLIDQMMSGKELVKECSDEFQWWNCCCYKAHYQKELEALDKSIFRFFQLDMQALLNRNVLEFMVGSRESSAEFSELKNIGLPPEPPAFTVGLDVPLNELKLRLLRDEVSVLTVTGSEGSGKTTLAKKFCWDDEVKGIFKENIFFVAYGKTPKLKTIVQKLYQHAGYQVPEIKSDKDAVKQFKCLLHQIWLKGVRPILLVMDDVWLESESLVNNFVFRAPNYKILVTSRFPIERFGSPYVLEPLGEPDAINLFHHSASLNQSTSDDVVKQIVRGCGGSPLALRVSGRSLSHQELIVWHNRAMELSTGDSIADSNSDVLSCLQKSLDVLDSEGMECFSYPGLFPEDERIPATALVDIWAELHNEDDASAMERIHELVNLNMADLIVTRSDTVDYHHYHYVTQHGLLRELAIRQTSQEPVDKRNRLIVEINGNKLPTWWTTENEYHIEARILSISTDETFTSEWCNLQPTEVEAFVLNLREMKCTLPMFMKKMNKLKALIITNYDFYPAELENFEMLAHLSGLKRIRLEKISIPFLSKTGVQLIKKLHKCSFFMCDVTEAFKSCAVQDSNMMPPSLVEMSFDHCNMVEFPVVFSNIVSLKKLNITICHKFSKLPEGIGNLVNLETLRLRSCSGLLELPDSITSLRNLKFLDISDCISLRKLPEKMGDLGKLEKLNVKGCSRISNLPSSIMDLGGLKLVVCDEETASSWETFTIFLSDLELEVAQADFSLGFLYTLRSQSQS